MQTNNVVPIVTQPLNPENVRTDGTTTIEVRGQRFGDSVTVVSHQPSTNLRSNCTQVGANSNVKFYCQPPPSSGRGDNNTK